jgi:hypothetical protein
VCSRCAGPRFASRFSGTFPSQRFRNAFTAIALLSVSLFAGQLIHSVASLLEGTLFWSLGGRPSEIALQRGLGERYRPSHSGRRSRLKLLDAVGDPDASNQSLFRYAIGLANAAPGSRSERFNGLYAYHRGLLVLAVLALGVFLGSARFGVATTWPVGLNWGVFGVFIGLLMLFWHRAKQRAFHYVAEVLTMAERALESAR